MANTAPYATHWIRAALAALTVTTLFSLTPPAQAAAGRGPFLTTADCQAEVNQSDATPENNGNPSGTQTRQNAVREYADVFGRGDSSAAERMIQQNRQAIMMGRAFAINDAARVKMKLIQCLADTAIGRYRKGTAAAAPAAAKASPDVPVLPSCGERELGLINREMADTDSRVVDAMKGMGARESLVAVMWLTKQQSSVIRRYCPNSAEFAGTLRDLDAAYASASGSCDQITAGGGHCQPQSPFERAAAPPSASRVTTQPTSQPSPAPETRKGSGTSGGRTCGRVCTAL